MLQQTVVGAAVGPFQAWMERWPTVKSLAEASEDEVLRAWEGLGYASRAKNLSRAARALISQGLTALPSDEDELRKLPGVGEYTAAAIASFAFDQPALTLDANLKRVFQRVDAQAEWSPALEQRWRNLWAERVDGSASRETNQAVMQLGQQICRAKNPLCNGCALRTECRAHALGLTETIPAKRARLVVERQTVVVFWNRNCGALWWLARPDKGRFSNLWMVPPGAPPKDAVPLTGRVHTYTKYRDRLTSWSSPWNEKDDPPLPAGWTGRWVDRESLGQVGMISVYRRLLEEALAADLGWNAICP